MRALLLTCCLALIVFLTAGKAMAARNSGSASDFNKFAFALHGGLLTHLGDIKQNQLLPTTDELGYGGGVSFKYQFSPALGLRMHALAGQMAGEKASYVFQADVIEVGMSLSLSINHALFPGARMNRWMSIYGFAGVGVAKHLTSLKETGTSNVEEEGIVAAIPFGVGVTFRLSERIDINIESGQRITGSDKLDGYVAGRNDCYNYTSAGISFRLGRKSRGEQWQSRYTEGAGISVAPLSATTRSETMKSTSDADIVPEPEITPLVEPAAEEAPATIVVTEPEPEPQPDPEPQPEPEPEQVVERPGRFVAEDADRHADHQFFIILGSFGQRANALRFQETLIKQGFDPTILVADSGLFRVSVDAFSDREAAISRIRQIRAGFSEYKDAWMLVREF